MTESKTDKSLRDVEEAENESQTLIPQTNIRIENNKLYPDLQNEQANNLQYADHRTETEQSKASASNILDNPPFKQSPYAVEKPSTLSSSSLNKHDNKKNSSSASNHNKCCKCCTCKCCGIASIVIFVILAILVAVGGVMWRKMMDKAQIEKEEKISKSEEWKTKLVFNEGSSTGAIDNAGFGIDGRYELVAYDKNYEKYMVAFGIPSFLVSLILGWSETIIVKESTKADDVYIFKTITNDGARVREKEKPLNKEFSYGYGRNNDKGTMHSICTIPERNVFLCETEERENNWKLTSKMEFSKLGLVNTRTFHGENIVAKKYYQRIGVDLSDEELKTVTLADADIIKIEKPVDDGEDPFEGDDDPFGDDEEW